jgi:hypothetical protein
MEYTSRYLVAKSAHVGDYPAVAFAKDGVEVIIDLQLLGLTTQHGNGSSPVQRVQNLIDLEWAAAAEGSYATAQAD